MSETADRAIDKRVDTLLVAAHGIAALVALLIAALFGIIISLQFFMPDLTGSFLPLGWGRLRYAHTQGVMFGWLGNAFLAFLYHAVPVLTGQAVTSRRLGLWLFGIWNFAVMLPGWTLVLAGVSQPLEWAEFPLPVDVFVFIALGLAAAQFLPAFFRRGLETLYVSSWYIIGALVFTAMSFPMGNIVPELVPGAAGAAFSGLWIHDAVGLFVTPLALAILYFVIPASTGRPIFSHFLSMLGFWGLFFLYPLNGTHHYVYSVIPMAAQISAIAASALLAVIVVIVVTNLLMSMRGAGVLPRDIALRFVAMSTILYLVVSVQGGMQAQMNLQRAVHFTDWVVAHSHLAMLGFASFAAIGGLIHAWQRIPWARYNAAALGWAYWLLTIGIIAMFVDLTIAGLVQAESWISGAPWLDSVRDSRPYWIGRTFSGLLLTAGFVAVLVGLTTGPRGAGSPALQTEPAEPAAEVVTPRLAATGAGRVLTMSYVVAGVAGVAFFAMSVTLLGVWPQRILAEQTATMAPPNPLRLTVAEERGRAIYAREGCAYCHTQQIRYTDADIERFGSPTLAWETRFDYPHLWGTRRIGPDLARAGGTRTENWHYVHLYAPRSVAPLSVMPSYAALFEGSPDRPTQEARDLVAYLETLGRARELAWPEGDAVAAAAAPNDRWAQMAFDAPLLNAHPGRTQSGRDVPALASESSADSGAMLWAHNCAGCHGASGRGDGPAAQWLRPRPTNLVEHEYTEARLAEALYNGVHGSSMPGWRDHSPTDRAALAEVVQEFADPQPGPTPSAQQLAQGQQVYAQHCASCHGPAGGGDGFAANDLPVPVAPTDFRNQRIDYEGALRVLRNGVDGTSMVRWTERLSDEEIQAAAHYVRSLFEGGD